MTGLPSQFFRRFLIVSGASDESDESDMSDMPDPPDLSAGNGEDLFG